MHATIKVCGNATKDFSENGNANKHCTKSVDYGSSALFDGNGDNLTIPSSDFDFGTGAYTVEMWIISRRRVVVL